jgi:hypothetical protein
LVRLANWEGSLPEALLSKVAGAERNATETSQWQLYPRSCRSGNLSCVQRPGVISTVASSDLSTPTPTCRDSSSDLTKREQRMLLSGMLDCKAQQTDQQIHLPQVLHRTHRSNDDPSAKFPTAADCPHQLLISARGLSLE